MSTQLTANSNKTTKKFIFFVIGIVIILACGLLLPVTEGGLTEGGRWCFGIFLSTVFLWITCDIGWPTLLAMSLIPMTGIYSAAQIFQISIGSTSVLFSATVTMFNLALTQCGVTERIAYWFLTRKSAKGKPWNFMFLFFLSALVIGYFMDCVPVTIIYIGLIDAIHKALGMEKGTSFGKALAFGSLVIIQCGYMGSPVAHVAPLLMIGVIESTTGIAVSVPKYLMIGIPLTLIVLVLTYLVIRFVMRPDVSALANYDAEAERAKLKPLGKDAKIILVVFALTVACWLFPDLLGGVFPGVAAFLTKISINIPPLLGIVALCLIKSSEGDRPILNFSEACKNCSWDVLIFIGGVLMFSGVVGNDATGIKAFLVGLVSPVSTVLPPFALAAAGLLFGVIVTSFMSNIVTQTIVYTVVGTLFIANPGFGMSAVAYGVLTTMLCNLAILTPAGTPAAAFIYRSGYMNTSEPWKPGFILILAVWVIAIPFLFLANVLL